MKKLGILNSEIASVLATLGHTDVIVIADAGLPIPKEVRRIDLALTKGNPSFLQVLDAVIEDMQIEKVTLAKEIKEKNQLLEEEILSRFSTHEIEYTEHQNFKDMTKNAKAIIRSGEMTPYANILLHAGVLF